MTGDGMTLDELDELIRPIDFPVSAEALADAWDRAAAPGEARGLSGGQIFLLVVFHVSPGRESRFEEAAADFIAATATLEGAVGSSLHHSSLDSSTWVLVERFAGRPAFERHMASDYFRTFQVEQRPLLAVPANAVFLEG